MGSLRAVRMIVAASLREISRKAVRFRQRWGIGFMDQAGFGFSGSSWMALRIRRDWRRPLSTRLKCSRVIPRCLATDAIVQPRPLNVFLAA